MYKKRLAKYDKIKFIREFLKDADKYQSISVLDLKLRNDLGHLEHRVVEVSKDNVLIYVYATDQNMVDSYFKGLLFLKFNQISKIYNYFVKKSEE